MSEPLERGSLTESTVKAQRWSARRRSRLVLAILRGEETVSGAARSHGLAPAEVKRWQEGFLEAGTHALREDLSDAESQRAERIRELERKLGEMALEMDRLRKALVGQPGAEDE